MTDKPSKATSFELNSKATSTSTSTATSTNSIHNPIISLRQSHNNNNFNLQIISNPIPDFNQFKAAEGSTGRAKRLRTLFDSIPIPTTPSSSPSLPILLFDSSDIVNSIKNNNIVPNDEQSREEERKSYALELWRKCGHCDPSSSSPSSSSLPSYSSSTSSASASSSSHKEEVHLRWQAFEKYAEEKEKELWRLFVELDQDGDMRLGKDDLRIACARGGVDLNEKNLQEFVDSLDRGHNGSITFEEWRDSFILLPRKPSMGELFRFWQTHRNYRPSMSQLTQDGDVVVGRGKTGWNKLLGKPALLAKEKVKERHELQEAMKDAMNLKKLENDSAQRLWAAEEKAERLVSKLESERESRNDIKGKGREVIIDDREVERNINGREDGQEEDDEDVGATSGMFSGAGKFLLAGGLAGAGQFSFFHFTSNLDRLGRS
jgi:hypothetical protein